MVSKDYGFTKLPKWAQAEFNNRDRIIRELRREIKALRAIENMEASEALEPDYLPKAAVLSPHHHKLPIGDGHVRYQLDKPYAWIDVRFVEDGWGPHVYISAGRGLEIQPSASNCVRLYVSKD